MNPIFCTLSLALTLATAGAGPIRALVWDEQQPRQKEAYENFLGNEIASRLKNRPDLVVTSANQAEPEQGLSKAALEATDVLVWWGHVKQRDISWEKGQEIVDRIKAGKLSLLALHSAHWSTPFITAMNERAKADALATLTPAEQKTAEVKLLKPLAYTSPKRDAPLTPSTTKTVRPDGTVLLEILGPNCCFPAYRPDAAPSHVKVLLPKHPLAAGLPATFDIPQTEMYEDPFHVPPADEVVFEESWDKGEKFRSGLVWKLGAGRIVYYRPGHEQYPVFKQEENIKVIENAVRFLAPAPAH